MKKIGNTGTLLGILSLAGTIVAAPPANDNFANAINLGNVATVSTTGDNTEATLEVGEPAGPFGERTGSIWYRWTAPASGWVRVDTLDSGFDTVLAVGTGTSIGNYTEIVFNDQNSNFSSGNFSGESLLFFQAQAGTVYRFAVCGWSENSGVAQLHIAPSAGPVATITSAVTSPPAANVTDAAVEVTLTLAAQSTEPIEVIDIDVITPNGNYLETGFAERTAGTPQNGTWTGTVTIPRYLAPGDYALSFGVYGGESFNALAEYGRDYSGFLPIPAGMESSIPVANTGIVDGEGPQVTAFSFSPTMVDVTSGSATVTCQFTASDPLAGVNSLYVSIYNSDFDYLEGAYVSVGDLVGGDANLGMYSVDIEVPMGTAPGSYFFSTDADDAVRNYHFQSSHPLEEFADGTLPGDPVLTVVNNGVIGSTPFARWAFGEGLRSPDSALLAIPFGDGVENLLKYAFNMNGGGPDHRVLVPGSGASGLPAIYRSPGGITVEYVAHGGEEADDDIFYTVETSTTGVEFPPADLPGIRTPINAFWDRVKVEVPVPPGGTVLARVAVGYQR